MKNKLIIPIHSFVDIITNSSTELFIIDKDKGLDMVKEIVSDAIKKHPPYYDCGNPQVYIENPSYYSNYYYHEHDIERAIKQLTLRGYKIIAHEEEKKPEAIIISWERGEMSREFIEYISQVFDVELEDC